MATTPPTAADMDAFLAAIDGNDGGTNMKVMLQNANGLVQSTASAIATYGAGGDAAVWIAGWTDNGGTVHYDLLGVTGTGVTGASDEQIEAGSVVASGNFPVSQPLAPPGFTAPPYLNALVAAYGAVIVRGYLIPGLSQAPLAPVSDAVQAWVNDSSNWAAPA